MQSSSPWLKADSGVSRYVSFFGRSVDIVDCTCTGMKSIRQAMPIVVKIDGQRGRLEDLHSNLADRDADVMLACIVCSLSIEMLWTGPQ